MMEPEINADLFMGFGLQKYVLPATLYDIQSQ